MFDVMRRHEIQVLRRAGHEVARLAGTSERTVRRVEEEPAVTSFDPSETRRRGIGRPSKAEGFRPFVMRVLASEPGAGIASRSEAGPPPGPRAVLPPDDELWDVHAAAKFLKRSVSWVYHGVEDGTLPVKRLAGWGVRFIPSELRAWVQEGGGSRR